MFQRGKQLKPASRVIFKTHARNKFVNSDGIFQVADDLDIPDGHEISRPGICQTNCCVIFDVVTNISMLW